MDTYFGDTYTSKERLKGYQKVNWEEGMMRIAVAHLILTVGFIMCYFYQFLITR